MKSQSSVVLFFLLLVLISAPAFTQTGIITTYAGPGLPVNGTLAAGQAIGGPSALVSNGDGAFYVAISGQNSVYQVTADGRIVLVAGNNTPGFSGDGGPATSAQLSHPIGLALDSEGNLFIADSDNDRIRRVGKDGVITSVAGTGERGFYGDNGVATAAQLCRPTGLAFHPSGDLYVADSCNNRIRKIELGVIKTIAGTGDAGFDSNDENGETGTNHATDARLNHPMGIAADSSGIIYIADTVNHRIRIVQTNGDIKTIAGNGIPGFSGDSGPALSAELNYPASVALDGSGNIYVADTYNYRVRSFKSGGTISTIAGNGTAGFSGDGGKATSAQLYLPVGMAVDASGSIWIADYVNRRVRLVKTDGIISTIAGMGTQGFGGDGGQATSAQLHLPVGAAVDSAGNLFIADSGNSRIRKIANSGIISTVAGDGKAGFAGDGGQALSASLHTPVGVAVDSAGNLFISDHVTQRIRKIATNGIITTIAGDGTPGFGGDGGPGISSRLNQPRGLAVDSSGSLFIADSLNHRIRKLSADGVIQTVAGFGAAGFSGDGSPATQAQLQYPAAVAVDSKGNLFIADFGNNRIRKVDTAGLISTAAGTGTPGFSGDGAQAIAAELYGPTGVAVDNSGNLFITDHQNNRIRKVAPDGTIVTFAGTGTAGFSGDGGAAISAQLNYPMSIASDSSGNLFISDYDNNRVRKIAQANGAASYFPQVAAGSGFSTVFTVTNTGSAPAIAVLHLMDSRGNPLAVQGTITDSAGITQVEAGGDSFPLTIPPHGRVFISAGSGSITEEPLKTGWGWLERLEGLPEGTASFEYMLNYSLEIVAGSLQSQWMREASIAVDENSTEGKRTAYAIANPGDQTLDLELILADLDGNETGFSLAFTIGPKQQISKYLSQDFAGKPFQGSLIFRSLSGTAFTAIALTDSQGLLTAIPLKIVKN